MSLFVVNLYETLVDLSGISALEPSKQIDSSFYSHTAALIVLGFAVVGTAPIAEEIFFRGFLFSGLDKRYGSIPGAARERSAVLPGPREWRTDHPVHVDRHGAGADLSLRQDVVRGHQRALPVQPGFVPGPRLRAQHAVISGFRADKRTMPISAYPRIRSLSVDELFIRRRSPAAVAPSSRPRCRGG